ncbi:hypothetical protein McpSp1_17290 [Methanocorpusculaceae archaeon Sp1]|nr:hypothetical protein [Methanocorpusculaceae archaeon Sp1]
MRIVGGAACNPYVPPHHKPNMLYDNTCHSYSMILGLPDITVIAVGGTIVVVFILLIIWGLTFPKGEEE